jgi:hypothetical protein
MDETVVPTGQWGNRSVRLEATQLNWESKTMRLKSWESPRKEGRNHKGRKKSARQRQLKKQTQVWRQKLERKVQGDGPGPTEQSSRQSSSHRSGQPPLLFCVV